ncbi:MAG: CheR family methyltransferase [Nanoarchaeota archaeon]
MNINEKQAFGAIEDIMSKRLGFDCRQYSSSFVRRRVEVRLRATGSDLVSYKSLLQRDEKEQKALSKEMSIHVTHFFRDADMWKVFRERVVADLISAARLSGKRRIRIWSAGCSTGEEPVSIMICLMEHLGKDLQGFQVELTATDIDAHTISAARKAVYEEIQFREMDEKLRKRYFTVSEDGRFRPIPEILQRIDYRIADIHVFKKQGVDVIFCRNTVIYFSVEAKSQLYTVFYDCLNDAGFLIIGKTEILQGEAREKFSMYDARERIYRK